MIYLPDSIQPAALTRLYAAGEHYECGVEKHKTPGAFDKSLPHLRHLAVYRAAISDNLALLLE